MLYYNYTFPRELKTLLCSLFYSITIFKKTNVHKIFTKKELYPNIPCGYGEFISIIPIEISIIRWQNDGDIFKLMECDN